MLLLSWVVAQAVRQVEVRARGLELAPLPAPLEPLQPLPPGKGVIDRLEGR